jgi:hypothetical protein
MKKVKTQRVDMIIVDDTKYVFNHEEVVLSCHAFLPAAGRRHLCAH